MRHTKPPKFQSCFKCDVYFSDISDRCYRAVFEWAVVKGADVT